LARCAKPRVQAKIEAMGLVDLRPENFGYKVAKAVIAEVVAVEIGKISTDESPSSIKTMRLQSASFVCVLGRKGGHS